MTDEDTSTDSPNTQDTPDSVDLRATPDSHDRQVAPAKEPLTPRRAAKFAGVAVATLLACTVIVVAAILTVSAFDDDSDDPWYEYSPGMFVQADPRLPPMIVVLGDIDLGDWGLGEDLEGLAPDWDELLPYLLPFFNLEDWLNPESLPEGLELERLLRDFGLQDLGSLLPEEPREATAT